MRMFFVILCVCVCVCVEMTVFDAKDEWPVAKFGMDPDSSVV